MSAILEARALLTTAPSSAKEENKQSEPSFVTKIKDRWQDYQQAKTAKKLLTETRIQQLVEYVKNNTRILKSFSNEALYIRFVEATLVKTPERFESAWIKERNTELRRFTDKEQAEMVKKAKKRAALTDKKI
ncbi:MAG TPA: hypothetical protein VLG44_00495 [Chlamydiales bacterium]|nr:hypothetical protein [Chlamydiales bacterium]